MPTVIQSPAQWVEVVGNAKKNAKVVIAKFSAEWCGPCKSIQPYFSTLESKYSDIIFVEIDIEGDTEDVADQFDIEKLPTFVVIKQEEESERLLGCDKDALEQLVSNQFKDSVQFCMDADF